MKVQDATKELSRRAAKLLGDMTSVRSAAEKTLAELRKIENGFVQQEEAQREEKRREEQQKALSAQSKAWTMPDDVPAVEEKKEAPRPAQPEAPRSEEKQPAVQPAQQPAPAQQRTAGPRPMGQQGGNFVPRGQQQGGNFVPRGQQQGGGFAPRGQQQGGNFA
ncbi:MAG: hypothetical protein J6K32_13070, partial [Clostridia bacterium]|nr:hypothetical protein [Clostridia bacterium]